MVYIDLLVVCHTAALNGPCVDTIQYSDPPHTAHTGRGASSYSPQHPIPVQGSMHQTPRRPPHPSSSSRAAMLVGDCLFASPCNPSLHSTSSSPKAHSSRQRVLNGKLVFEMKGLYCLDIPATKQPATWTLVAPHKKHGGPSFGPAHNGTASRGGHTSSSHAWAPVFSEVTSSVMLS
jgi:hypothetical protein